MALSAAIRATGSTGAKRQTAESVQARARAHAGYSQVLQGLRVAATQGFGPLGPRAGLVFAAQYGIKHVVVEPCGFGAAEVFEILPLIDERGIVNTAIEKVSCSLIEQGELTLFYLLKIDRSGTAGQPGNAFAVDPAPVGKVFEADESGIAGKCRRAGIRRIAESRGQSGRTCHTCCLARAKKPTNSWAAGPRSPMPPYEGNEVTCSKTPEERRNSIFFLLSDARIGVLAPSFPRGI